MNGRRRAVLLVAEQFIADFVRNGERHYRITNGIPFDATVVGVHYDRGIWEITLESAAFEEIPANKRYPELPPVVVTSIDCRREAAQ
jgi:hypothetical protein